MNPHWIQKTFFWADITQMLKKKRTQGKILQKQKEKRETKRERRTAGENEISATRNFQYKKGY